MSTLSCYIGLRAESHIFRDTGGWGNFVLLEVETYILFKPL